MLTAWWRFVIGNILRFVVTSLMHGQRGNELRVLFCSPWSSTLTTIELGRMQSLFSPSGDPLDTDTRVRSIPRPELGKHQTTQGVFGDAWHEEGDIISEQS